METVQIAVLDFMSAEVALYSVPVKEGQDSGDAVEEFLFSPLEEGGQQFDTRSVEWMSADEIRIEDRR